MRCAAVVFAVGLTANLCHSEVVVQHVGNTDPGSECWRQFGAGTGVTQGPVSDDGGVDAWLVDDNSTQAGSLLAREHELTVEQVQDATTIGWTLLVCLRIVELPDPLEGIPSSSPAISYRNGARAWDMHFGSDDAGAPAVKLVTAGGNGIVITLADSGYHLFELTYDPVADSASLSIDGDLRATGYGGFAHASAPAILWGAFTQNDTGHANFSLVEFAIGELDATDCNSNGILDTCEIQLGESEDVNNDGVPDDCQPCLAADIDGDGQVGIGDFLLVLAQWGPCPPKCFADVNGDGDVGIADFLMVLGAWGPCP